MRKDTHTCTSNSNSIFSCESISVHVWQLAQAVQAYVSHSASPLNYTVAKSSLHPLEREPHKLSQSMPHNDALFTPLHTQLNAHPSTVRLDTGTGLSA